MQAGVTSACLSLCYVIKAQTSDDILCMGVSASDLICLLWILYCSFYGSCAVALPCCISAKVLGGSSTCEQLSGGRADSF